MTNTKWCMSFKKKMEKGKNIHFIYYHYFQEMKVARGLTVESFGLNHIGVRRAQLEVQT